MRLTLRTLLAYMDEILEPEDAQEIAKKIADSPVATDLMHRIRDVMRRLRLGAPGVLDRAAGLDANTVAEYLDNTLSDAQVPDFETICLESDVQLAEVASCHRILALVLGEPAEVDPTSRQRAYQLPHLSVARAEEEAHAGPPPLPGVSSAVSAAESAEEAGESRVPSYLREPATGRRRRWMVGLAVVALLGVGLLAFSGWFGGRNLLAELLGIEPAATPEGGAPGVNPPAAPSVFGGPRPTESKTPAEGKDGGLGENGPRGKTAGLGEAGGGGKTAGLGETGPEPKGPKAKEPADETTPAIPPPLLPKQLAPGEPGAVAPLPKDVAPGQGGLTQPPGAVAGEGGTKLPGPSAPGTGLATEKPKAAQRVGRLVSTKEVLLSFFPQPDPQGGVWRHVPGQADLHAGDRLQSLPAFRPLIALEGYVKVQLIDGASVQLLPPDAQHVPGLAVSYGRIVLNAEEASGAKLRLRLGERMVLVSLEGIDSTLCLDVRRQTAPGADPETQPGPVTADVYATSGKSGWQDDPGQPAITLDAPLRRTWGPLLGDAEAGQQFPKWIYADTTSPLDQRGAPVLERELASGRPARLVLRELVDFRLREVRSLAIRSLALLGDFESLIKTLDDPDQRLSWDDSAAQLRAGAMRSPDSAAVIRSTMERFYGPEGANLYEMLWKYGPVLSAAEAGQLTNSLDHETLAFRVLAFWNLKTIYSGATLVTFNYHPEYPAAKRQVAIQAWKERAKTPPAPRDTAAKRGSTTAPKKVPAETAPPPEAETP